MKLVREYINEKFAEESDPIKDMGIGLYSKRVFETIDQAAKYLMHLIPAIINTNKIPYDIISPTTEYFMPRKYWNPLYEYIIKYIFIKDNKVRAIYALNLLNALIIQLKAKGFKKINEKFTEESDAIHDMGIGMDKIINDWYDNLIIKSKPSDFVKGKNDSQASKLDALLATASENNKINYVKYLLDKGADVNVGQAYPLRWALYLGHIKMAKLLIKEGSDINEVLNWQYIYRNPKYITNMLDVGITENTIRTYAIQHNLKNILKTLDFVLERRDEYKQNRIQFDYQMQK
jgi:hypothetical protein